MSHQHKSQSNIGIAFILNVLFTIIEFIGGLLTNSIAITSDAIHDFGDSLSLGLAWYFEKLSNKGSTKRYTYGYKRFSLLGAIINCVVLIIGSIYIFVEAVPRLFSPQVTNAKGMFALAIVGVLINGIAALRTKNSKSINEKVVSLHLFEDVLGWMAILVGSIIMHFTAWTIIDPILSLLIAGFVLFNVFKNIQLVLPILLQGTPSAIEHQTLIDCLKNIDSIKDIHDLHVWSLDETYNVLTLHIVLNKNLDMAALSELKTQIRLVLKTKKIQHTTIEFEAPNEACSLEACCVQVV